MGKWTKGPWMAEAEVNHEGGYTGKYWLVMGQQPCAYDFDRLEDAQLAAEAGTVATETGLTPRQLAERCKNLLSALKEARTDLMIAANNADHAARTDNRWEGVGNVLRSRVEKCDDAIANAERQS